MGNSASAERVRVSASLSGPTWRVNVGRKVVSRVVSRFDQSACTDAVFGQGSKHAEEEK